MTIFVLKAIKSNHAQCVRWPLASAKGARCLHSLQVSDLGCSPKTYETTSLPGSHTNLSMSSRACVQINTVIEGGRSLVLFSQVRANIANVFSPQAGVYAFFTLQAFPLLNECVD